MTTSASTKWAESLSLENLFTERAGKDGVLLALAALPTWFFCMTHNFCMCGYMAHPPYSSWQIVINLFTLAALLSAGTLLLLSAMRWRYALAGVVAGQLVPLSLWHFGPLLLLWLAIAAAVGLKAWLRRTPRHGRSARLFEAIIWGLAGLAASLLMFGFGL